MSQKRPLQVLKPFLLLYRRHIWRLSIGVVLAIITLLASIGLLTLSGWFLAGASLAGLAGFGDLQLHVACGGRARCGNPAYCRALCRAFGQP